MGGVPVQLIQQAQAQAAAQAAAANTPKGGQVLTPAPAGGPMSFAPPQGQPMRGSTQYLGPQSPNRTYTPNAFNRPQMSTPSTLGPGLMRPPFTTQPPAAFGNPGGGGMPPSSVPGNPMGRAPPMRIPRVDPRVAMLRGR